MRVLVPYCIRQTAVTKITIEGYRKTYRTLIKEILGKRIAWYEHFRSLSENVSYKPEHNCTLKDKDLFTFPTQFYYWTILLDYSINYNYTIIQFLHTVFYAAWKPINGDVHLHSIPKIFQIFVS
jgi:hypothetical protein